MRVRVARQILVVNRHEDWTSLRGVRSGSRRGNGLQMRGALQILVNNKTTEFRALDVVACGATDAGKAQCVHVAFLDSCAKSCTAQ